MEILYTILFALGCLLLGYLFGSIPSGVIIAKMHGINISDYGSGNTGGTNVGRTLGKKAGIMTMVLDALKCIVPMLIVLLVYSFSGIKNSLIEYKYLAELYTSLTALAVMVGHTLPLFNHFKGGKCVACFAGYMLFTSPIMFVVGCLIFFIMFKLFHRISICSIVSVPSLILLALIPMILDFTILPSSTDFNGGMYFGSSFMLHISYITLITIILAAILIILRHKANIKRIHEGTEPETHFQNIVDQKKED